MTKEEKKIYNAAYYIAHREDENARSAAWRMNNREEDLARKIRWAIKNKDDMSMRRAIWRAANLERDRACHAAWDLANRENRRAALNSWRAANPEKVRAQQATRRARKLAAHGQFTSTEISDLLVKQKYRCVNCLTYSLKKRYDIDHIIPLVRGGSNNIQNIQLLCPSCNLKKSSKDPIRWAREQGRLL